MSVRVVASVIVREGRILICRRGAGKRHGGMWEFPGGKVEPGESDLDAVARELAEELAVEVRGVGAVLFTRRDPGSEYVIDFLPVEIEGEPVCLEHEQIAWVAPEELLVRPLAPADRDYAIHRLVDQP